MKLEIISPEKIYFNGEVSLVTLPGKLGKFTVLEQHAPIVSMLDKGVIIYRTNGIDNQLAIDAGFVEVNKNKIVVCVEKLYK
jgi:F-type H+-transporting ATPase subunit epsilon